MNTETNMKRSIGLCLLLLIAGALSAQTPDRVPWPTSGDIVLLMVPRSP